MKKLSTGTEKELLQTATRLAEILSLENIENKECIDLGQLILQIKDDPTISRRFKNGREQKLEIIRDVIVDLSAGAPWLKKGSFGLVAQNNLIKKIYLLDEIQLKGQFLYQVVLAPKYKDPKYSFKQSDVDYATYYMIYHWSQFTRTLAKSIAA
jgi:hypothetical protein